MIRLRETGFTIIEIIIVLAIIGLLASFALPVYNNYVTRAATDSCLWEVKSYTNQVFLDINDQDINTAPQAPIIKACDTITDATDWTLVTQEEIVALAKRPSQARIKCDLLNGASCKLAE